MVEVVKLVTPADADRNEDAARLLKFIEEEITANQIDGLAVAIRFRDGRNYTNWVGAEDTLFMVGLLDYLKHRIMQKYLDMPG